MPVSLAGAANMRKIALTFEPVFALDHTRPACSPPLQNIETRQETCSAFYQRTFFTCWLAVTVSR